MNRQDWTYEQELRALKRDALLLKVFIVSLVAIAGILLCA